MSIDFTPLELLALIAGVVLLLLLIFRRKQFFKFVFSVFHAIGELCRHVEDMLDLVGEWCSKTVLGILMWGRKEAQVRPTQEAVETESEARAEEEPTTEGSVVVTFLFRVIVLVLSATIMTCEFVLAVAATGVVIPGAEGKVPLPIRLDVALGGLFFSTCALWGSLFLEGIGFAHESIAFFPKAKKAGRWVMAIGGGLGFLLTVFVVALAYALRSMRLQHYSERQTDPLVLLLNVVLGVLVAGVSLIAFQGLLLGASALLTIVFSALWLLSYVLKLPMELLRRVFMLLATLGGTVIITEPGTETGSTALSPLTADDVWELSDKENPGREKWAKARSAVRLDADRLTVKVKPVPYQTLLIGEGKFGLDLMMGSLSYPSLSLTVKNKLVLVGYAPTDLDPTRELGKLIRNSGAEDISLTSSQRKEAVLGASTLEVQNKRILEEQLKKIVRRTQPGAAPRLLFLFVRAEVVSELEESLSRLHRLLKTLVIVPVVEISGSIRAGSLQSVQNKQAIEMLLRLHQAGVISCAILVDLQPQAFNGQSDDRGSTRGRNTKLVVSSLNGFMRMHVDERNLTGAQLFTELGTQYPLFTIAAGSRVLPPGKPIGWSSRGVGRGDVDLNLALMEELGEDILKNQASRLFPVPLSFNASPSFGMAMIPFPPDHRFETIRDKLELWTAQQASDCRLVALPASGVLDGTLEGRYFGQWTWLIGFDETALALGGRIQRARQTVSLQPRRFALSDEEKLELEEPIAIEEHRILEPPRKATGSRGSRASRRVSAQKPGQKRQLIAPVDDGVEITAKRPKREARS
jgi:hypothetical protein